MTITLYLEMLEFIQRLIKTNFTLFQISYQLKSVYSLADVFLVFRNILKKKSNLKNT